MSQVSWRMTNEAIVASRKTQEQIRNLNRWNDEWEKAWSPEAGAEYSFAVMGRPDSMADMVIAWRAGTAVGDVGVHIIWVASTHYVRVGGYHQDHRDGRTCAAHQFYAVPPTTRQREQFSAFFSVARKCEITQSFWDGVRSRTVASLVSGTSA